MVTIAIDETTRKKLLIIAANLQKNYGKKVNFNDVLRYLTKMYEERIKNPSYFKHFCEPIQPNISFDELYNELIEERRRDENKFTR